MNLEATLKRRGTAVPNPGAGLHRAIRQGVLLPGLAIVCEVRIAGREHLAGAGPAIIVANHESLLDWLVVVKALPRARRDRVAITAAADYFFTSAVRGALVRSLVSTIPVERGGSGRGAAALDASADHLSDGGSVVIFPEGTRSPDGHCGRFHNGAARLALATGVPVMPLGMFGTAGILPKGTRLPRPGTVWVHAGEPLPPSAGSDIGALSDAIEASVMNLRAAARAHAMPDRAPAPAHRLAGGAPIVSRGDPQ